jgi:hypothetical protein
MYAFTVSPVTLVVTYDPNLDRAGLLEKCRVGIKMNL